MYSVHTHTLSACARGSGRGRGRESAKTLQGEINAQKKNKWKQVKRRSEKSESERANEREYVLLFIGIWHTNSNGIEKANQ